MYLLPIKGNFVFVVRYKHIPILLQLEEICLCRTLPESVPVHVVRLYSFPPENSQGLARDQSPSTTHQSTTHTPVTGTGDTLLHVCRPDNIIIECDKFDHNMSLSLTSPQNAGWVLVQTVLYYYCMYLTYQCPGMRAVHGKYKYSCIQHLQKENDLLK